MFWDDLIRRWRRETRLPSQRLLRAAGGHVAVLPAPRPRRRRGWLLAALIVLGIAALLMLGSGRASAAVGIEAASSDRAAMVAIQV